MPWSLGGISSYNKKTCLIMGRFNKRSATTYSPTINAVPSAQAGLTTLFGMGRGGPRRYSHQKAFNNVENDVQTIRIDILKDRLHTLE